jgi:UDP-N-acetylmuramoylalanine--D-glutamate ligase
MPILDGARNLGIWGFGAEGRAAFQHVCINYPHLELTILSDNALSPTDTDLIATAARTVSVVTGEAVPKVLEAGTLDLVIKSPGVSLHRPDVVAAKARGVRFTSTTNLWFEQNPTATTIVVTGTKGKSTTARLLHHLLCRAGIDASLLGNVGIRPWAVVRARGIRCWNCPRIRWPTLRSPPILL